MQPGIPDTRPGLAEALVGSLRRDGEWFGGGEGLDGDVEVGVRGEVAATMAEIRPPEEGGVWERSLVAFEASAFARSAGGPTKPYGQIDEVQMGTDLHLDR